MRIATLIGSLGLALLWGCPPSGVIPPGGDDPAGSPADPDAGVGLEGEGNAGSGQGAPAEGDGLDVIEPGGVGQDEPDGEPPVAGECRATDVPFTGFAAGDSWIIASRFFDLDGEPLLMGMGSGERISGVFLGADFMSGPGCAGVGDDVVFTIDGSTIELSADLTSFDDGEGCSLELSGTIDPCGADVLGLTVFYVVGDAKARIGGEEYVLDDLEIIRVPSPEPVPCEEPIESLADRSWSISNEDMGGLGGFGMPLPTGPSVSLWGFGDQIESADIFSGFFDLDNFEDEPLGCLGAAPEGEFSFDGETLSIDITMSSDNDDSPCSVVFSGTVASCTLPGGGFADFPFESNVRLLRVEGAGQFSGGGLEGTLDVLFVTVFDSFGEPENGEACRESPASLEGTDWQLAIENPLSFSLPPDSAEVFLSMSGAGEELGDSALFVGEFGDDIPVGCSDFMPEGTVSFDGETFSIDAQMAGFSIDEEDAEPCTVRFTGRVESCTLYVDPFGFDEGGGMTVLELVGEGEYVSAAGTGTLTTMYLTLFDGLMP
jgi:hypothetical protein